MLREVLFKMREAGQGWLNRRVIPRMFKVMRRKTIASARASNDVLQAISISSMLDGYLSTRKH